MAEITLKLSRKPADLHAARPVTARKPEPPKRAEAQGAVSSGHEDLVCCNCWSVNRLDLSETPQGPLEFRCWSCGCNCIV